MVAIGSLMTYCMNKILILYTLGKETSATVFGAYFKLNSFIFMPIFGMNNGVIPIIAYNYGAGNKKRMTDTIKLSVIYAEGFMIIGALLFILIPNVLLGFFSASEAMLKIGVPAFRVIATSFFFAGICISLGTVFQALGKSIFSMIVSLVRQIFVLVPSAFILARLGLQTGNQNLVWWSYPIAEIFSLAITMICFIKIYNTVIKYIPEQSPQNKA